MHSPDEDLLHRKVPSSYVCWFIHPMNTIAISSINIHKFKHSLWIYLGKLLYFTHLKCWVTIMCLLFGDDPTIIWFTLSRLLSPNLLPNLSNMF